MSITYAGVPLLLPDGDGILERFLADFQCQDELRVFAAQATWQAANRGEARSGFSARVSMAAPNWPFVPGPRINTLYWPTGAARWAWGLFIATKSQVDAILYEIAPSSGGTTLGESSAEMILLDDESGSKITAVGMHLLPPRPISVPGISADKSLWLLPIVDNRYFWQLIDLGTIATVDVLDETSTWPELWGLIQTALGITITKGEISADYFQPDPREFTREHQNIAMLMDAAAAAVGQRIVRQLDGSVESLGSDNGTSALTGNLSGSGSASSENAGGGPYSLIAGGDFSDSSPWSIRPEKVKVAFPRYDLGRPDCAGAVYAEEVAATSLGVTSYRSNLFKTFFNTAFADFGGNVAATTPTNTANLATLATKIATDYYAWLAKQFDYTFVGVKPWAMSGFEDWVEWTFGGHRQGKYLAYTRVHSLPANFGVEDLANQFGLPVHDEWLIAQLTSPMNPGSSATAVVLYKSGGVWLSTGDTIVVHDPAGAFTFETGDRVEVHWHCQAKEWQVVNGPC